MHSLLKKYILFNSNVSSAAFDADLQLFTPLKAAKSKQLLLAGQVCQYLYFINKGCIRTYYLNAQGQEKTRFIAFEGIIIASLSSFISQQPSFEFIDAIENSELLAIRRSDFFSLIEKNQAWKNFYVQLLEQAYIYQNKKIELRTTLTAKQRYAELLKQKPQWVLRLPNRVLASYLDVSQETLSRLKSK